MLKALYESDNFTEQVIMDYKAYVEKLSYKHGYEILKKEREKSTEYLKKQLL